MELLPFVIPDCVIIKSKCVSREDGWQPLVQFDLDQLDEDVLERMCDEFRRGVMEKAGYGVFDKRRKSRRVF